MAIYNSVLTRQVKQGMVLPNWEALGLDWLCWAAPGLFSYLPALESKLLSASATEVGQDLWTWCPLPPAERAHTPLGLLPVFGREWLENSLDARRNWDDFWKLLVGFGASSDTQQGKGRWEDGQWFVREQNATDLI